MKKYLPCLTLCLTLAFSFGSQAFAYNDAEPVSENSVGLVETVNASKFAMETAAKLAATNSAADSLAVSDGPYFLLNGAAVTDPSLTVTNGTTYVSLQSVVEAYGGVITWPGKKAEVTLNGLSMTVGVGDRYILANERALYVEGGVQYINGRVALPIRILAQAMGGGVTWDAGSGVCSMTTGTPILAGASFYNYDDLFWLSHIINAESGSEPLSGKLAVGTVILNRVSSTQFPNSIYDVVFDRRGGVWQFTPAGTGSVHRTPNDESVIAAKLCLEGAREGGDSLYFVNLSISPNCWARRNRPYVDTIGRHTFYA